MSRGKLAVGLVIGVVCALAGARADAQSVSASERDRLVRLRTERGGRAEEVDALIRLADQAAAKGLPTAPLINKVQEGLAKGYDSSRIEPVIRQLAAHLETADRLVRESEPAITPSGRDAAVTLMADALSTGVTPSEVLDIRQQALSPGSSQTAISGEILASAAKGLSFIKDARLPPADGTAVLAEAMRHGFRAHEILDLGREVKRRENDYRAGRVSLRALRDAIVRGERPEQLLRESRATTPERPAAVRPQPVERPARPETPQRPEPVRPERPAAR